MTITDKRATQGRIEAYLLGPDNLPCTSPLGSLPRACDRCGACCRQRTCTAGERAFGAQPQYVVCRALIKEGEEHACLIVEVEAQLVAEGKLKEPLIAQALGVGKGCCDVCETARGHY